MRGTGVRCPIERVFSTLRYEIGEPYGVDEFMYFLEGGVTLTSVDGSKQVINE